MSNGRIVISEADPWAARGYETLGTVAKSLGLTWGGSWRTIKDLGHVELPRPGVLGRRGPNAATAAVAAQ
jgi:peptidoglycan L-alanyl-D-glutamate endopeptidase CwlK